MIESEKSHRDLAVLVVPRDGRVVSTGGCSEPYRLLDADGEIVEPVSLFLPELLAAGRSAATLRSYGMDLLRWWRFLQAVEVDWDRATRVEARDFSCWIQLTVKHRRPRTGVDGAGWVNSVAAQPNPITVKPTLGTGYAVATVAHSETVLRGFYDFHRDAGTGPILNPFPLDRARRSRRAHSHRNPMDGWAHERVGRYRPKMPRRIPRAIPDQRFNELFAALRSNRDRALVAFWISTGVRASELLGVRQCDIDPGQQLITVVRKGTRASQQVPASADAFVWLRLYQEEMHGQIPPGRIQPLWWTLRRPRRPFRTANDRRLSAARLLAVAEATEPGAVIDGSNGALRKAVVPNAIGRIVWAEDIATGKRRNLSYEEDEAFWAFATIEVLRLTGIRCEELLELSHHSITEYRLPGTGELVPLLQIAPSKTDTERMLLVSPELADVLSAIVQRLRGPDGSIPVVVSYDIREKIWHPPMPVLFQRGIGNERHAFTPAPSASC
ncbi:site-specific integrase [Nocardia lijiangensis]|uniref:site-specific integrase n=1 Tax=Nocardia lijiangensis TaxID=299618 RepID=UPI000A8BB8C5|nr:site-specific integrase [Nocardia lijiangensis]